MFGCQCFQWSRIAELLPPDTKTFSLPAPIPTWPQGSWELGCKNVGFCVIVLLVLSFFFFFFLLLWWIMPWVWVILCGFLFSGFLLKVEVWILFKEIQCGRIWIFFFLVINWIVGFDKTLRRFWIFLLMGV